MFTMPFGRVPPHMALVSVVEFARSLFGLAGLPCRTVVPRTAGPGAVAFARLGGHSEVHRLFRAVVRIVDGSLAR